VLALHLLGRCPGAADRTHDRHLRNETHVRKALADQLLGIDSASVALEEDVMTDPNRPDAIDPTDASDTTARDPDRHSTWNTLDRSVDIDEVIDEDDLENFFVEPIPDPLDPDYTPDR
jgi:hypothetical protein